MGQKTHPKGFRLVTTQKHLSNWYSKKSNYPSLIEEDFLIRENTEKFFKELLVISKVEITRITNENNPNGSVDITIVALFPRAKEMYRKVTNYFTETKELEKKPNLLKNLKGNLRKFTAYVLQRNTRNLIRKLQLKTNKTVHVSIKFVKNPFEDATLIAKFIADQLEKRVPFRRAVKQTIKKVQLTSMKGVKVEVSGRLNGIEIARSEWKRDGKIPLHTLRAQIDYTHQKAYTIYGIIGIKVWLFVQ